VIDSQFDQLSISRFPAWKRQIGGTAIQILDLTNAKVDDTDVSGEVMKNFDGLKVLKRRAQARRE